MIDNIIYQHDVLIKRYEWWEECREKALQEQNEQTARDLSFMIDGLSDAFYQIFKEDIRKAKIIYKGDMLYGILVN